LDLRRKIVKIARIAALCAAAVWLTSAFAAQNPADSWQATPAVGLHNASPSATYTVLYNASGDPNPGFLTGVVQGRDGNFYGGSYEGGANNLGSIYMITPAGAPTVIYSLTAADGNPQCNPSVSVLGTDGNFYGACSYNSDGYIFKVTPAGVFTHLHDFTGTDGMEPFLEFQGSDGNFYGGCQGGGSGGEGTVFKITPAGTLTTIYSFASGAPIYEPAGLVQSSNGDFYGVGYTGSGTQGGVFKLTAAGVLTPLHDFEGGASDGTNPSGLALGTDGNFYGATEMGGVNNQGTIYKITPGGTFTLLHSFNVTADGGEYPSAPLTQGSDGNFYSTAVNCDVFGCAFPENIFEITPRGVYTSLASFDTTNGEYPFAGVIQDTGGIFFGVTDQGGTSGDGVFYSLNNSLSAFVSLVSTSAKVGKTVGILGQGFTNGSVVKFDGVQATTVTRTGTTFLSATVPAGALTGLVTVTTGATTLTSNKKFQVTPKIISFSPPSGPVGTPVTITGSGLTQATKVTFNNTVATFTVNSDAQITATVPTGATTGKIGVITKGGKAKSSTSFTVN
jgi:uncharacterized repeat protein (TIGR03803 family)